jgi:hypothetical protein
MLRRIYKHEILKEIANNYNYWELRVVNIFNKYRQKLSFITNAANKTFYIF